MYTEAYMSVIALKNDEMHRDATATGVSSRGGGNSNTRAGGRLAQTVPRFSDTRPNSPCISGVIGEELA